jgi:AraC-like DNA-binding protein
LSEPIAEINWPISKIDKAAVSKPLAVADILWQPRRMTLLLTLDLLARGGSLSLLLLWNWLLLRDQRAALAARVAVAMNFAIIAYLSSYHAGELRPLNPFSLFVNWASVLAAPLFWLFAHVWFSDAVRLSRRSILLVAGFAVLAFVQTIIITASGDDNPVVWMAVRIGMIGFAIAGLWAAWRERDNDLVEARRRFRSGLIWVIGLFVIWVSIMEIPRHGGDWNIAIRVVTELAIAFAAGSASAVMYRFRQSDLFAPPAPDSPNTVPRSVSADPALAERVQEYMQTEMAWRDETLSIAKLAAHLGEQEYRLRRTINGAMGYRNFASFLNSYRLDEVKQALNDPSQKEVPIITIALDAGFGSLGPFNRAFREAEGMTPSEYRNHAA